MPYVIAGLHNDKFMSRMRESLPTLPRKCLSWTSQFTDDIKTRLPAARIILNISCDSSTKTTVKLHWVVIRSSRYCHTLKESMLHSFSVTMLDLGCKSSHCRKQWHTKRIQKVEYRLAIKSTWRTKLLFIVITFYIPLFTFRHNRQQNEALVTEHTSRQPGTYSTSQRSPSTLSHCRTSYR